MKEELKPQVPSEISLSAMVNSTSGVTHQNEPSLYEEFVEQAVGIIYTDTTLELMMEEEIKPEVGSAILLAAHVDSTLDVLHPNEMKKEFSLSEPHSYALAHLMTNGTWVRELSDQEYEIHFKNNKPISILHKCPQRLGVCGGILYHFNDVEGLLTGRHLCNLQ